MLGGKLKRLSKAFEPTRWRESDAFISTGSVANLQVANSSIDYIFTDPPFGENIFYADLNFLVEGWHGVVTAASAEAIVDKPKKKGLPEYQHLMQKSFSEYYRVLKPGRWMTVVFSNSKAAVWNAIQVALQQAGFVVAEVTAARQGARQLPASHVCDGCEAGSGDLCVQAKWRPRRQIQSRWPDRGFGLGFRADALEAVACREVTSGYPQELLNIVERDPRRIYVRMASWFIRHGAMVPISTPEFLAELPVRFREMDGMLFLPDQLVEYEKARSRIPQVKQAELFVSDERSAIDWLTNFLLKRPSTRSEIHPEYIPQIGSAKRKGEIIPGWTSCLGQLPEIRRQW